MYEFHHNMEFKSRMMEALQDHGVLVLLLYKFPFLLSLASSSSFSCILKTTTQSFQAEFCIGL